MLMNGEHQANALASAPMIDRNVAIKAVNLEPYIKFRQEQDAIASARTKPLPGSSLKAFTSGAINAGGKIVQRVVPAHFAVLQALDSPLIKMIENATNRKDEEAEFKPAQQWEVCYVFTQDIEQIFTELEEKGVKAIKSAARKEIGMKWEAAAVNVVLMAVLEQVKRHIQTTVKMVGEMEKEGEVTFFREQPVKS